MVKRFFNMPWSLAFSSLLTSSTDIEIYPESMELYRRRLVYRTCYRGYGHTVSSNPRDSLSTDIEPYPESMELYRRRLVYRSCYRGRVHTDERSSNVEGWLLISGPSQPGALDIAPPLLY